MNQAAAAQAAQVQEQPNKPFEGFENATETLIGSDNGIKRKISDQDLKPPGEYGLLVATDLTAQLGELLFVSLRWGNGFESSRLRCFRQENSRSLSRSCCRRAGRSNAHHYQRSSKRSSAKANSKHLFSPCPRCQLEHSTGSEQRRYTGES